MNWQTPRRKPAIAKVEAAPGLVLGEPILAACSKCKARTSHTVIAKIGVKPTRVQCSTCNDTHAFKSTPTRRAVPASVAHLSPEEAYAASMRHARGDARAYAANGRYEIGQRVTHPTFGEGVVMRLASATVCEVVFPTRTVKLVMGPVTTGIDWAAPTEARVAGSRLRSRRRMG